MGFRARLGEGLALLICFSACRGGAPADTAERVEKFEAMLSEELGTEVKLECPAMIDQSHHYCTAVVPAHEGLAFPVRVVSRGNELDYATKRWVSGKRMVDLGTHTLEEKFDIEVDSLECPPISHMPDGATVRCEATSQGVSIPLEVSMVVKVRKLHFEPVGGVVFGDEAARVAHEALHEQGVHAEVSCPQKVVVSVAGTHFECQATMPNKTVTAVRFAITDANGSIELDADLPEDPAPADSDHDHEGETPT